MATALGPAVEGGGTYCAAPGGFSWGCGCGNGSGGAKVGGRCSGLPALVSEALCVCGVKPEEMDATALWEGACLVLGKHAKLRGLGGLLLGFGYRHCSYLLWSVLGPSRSCHRLPGFLWPGRSATPIRLFSFW